MSSAPTATPSMRKRTPTTPTSSSAVAVSVVVPTIVAPAAGAVTATVGAVTSLSTVIATPAETTLLPAASRAIAVTVCGPLATAAELQLSAYGAVVSSAPGDDAVDREAARPRPPCRRWRSPAG